MRTINGYIITWINSPSIGRNDPRGPALGPFPEYETARAYAEKHYSDVGTVVEPLYAPSH